MRVSNLSTKNSMIYEMKRNYQDLKTTEKQLGSGKRFQKISEDPIRSITSIYSRIRLNQIDQYSQNLNDGADRVNITFDKLLSVVNMLRRTRELTIYSANGPLTPQDRANMSFEVGQLLEEIINHANTQFEQGYIFSGSKTDTLPFETIYSNDSFGNRIVEKVEYRGDAYSHKTDISFDENIETGLTGNQVFWAEKHTVVSLTDGRNYVATEDQKFSIDDYGVQINAGDNLNVIIEKINQNIPSVNAFSRQLPGGELALGLESNHPHQMAILDTTGTVLTDLGILKPGVEGREIFNNISTNTLENQGSIFDVLIRFQRSLVDNNIENLGGDNLQEIDDAINNVLFHQTKISSVASRIKIDRQDLELEKENITTRLSKAEDMDMAEAAINLSEINYVHQLSLQTAARYIRPTLLDFL